MVVRLRNRTDAYELARFYISEGVSLPLTEVFFKSILGSSESFFLVPLDIYAVNLI